MTIERTLRVTTVRSQNPKGFGGCIFTAKPVDADGQVQDAASYYVVKVSASALAGLVVERGQLLT